MWQLKNIDNPMGASLWFSDGMPVDMPRGGNGVSSRLIVDGQGFVDITDAQIATPNDPATGCVDFNGLNFNYSLDGVAYFNLRLPGDGSFSATALDTGYTASGQQKPLPVVSVDDAAFLDKMMVEKYVPYQNIPDAPGKTTEQIKQLGLQYFPFTPYSFELAMSVYDWTSASFTRMVLMKIFQYTASGQVPLPLDQDSIASAIWESDWMTYNPGNADYMNSFMMVPADSLQNVQAQLAEVAPQLQQFSDVENRLLAAAFQAMPRTSLIAMPQLFSGQVDIQQLGTEHFGIEFLQCPLNAGPVTEPLQMPLEEALATFVSVGSIITTKMVWSFGDSMDEAMQYQNGIVLVANPPEGSWVWNTVSYITTLSDDPAKIEYTFAPGTSFLVQSIEQTQVDGNPVCIINLQAR